MPGENHRPAASYRQILSHKDASTERDSNSHLNILFIVLYDISLKHLTSLLFTLEKFEDAKKVIRNCKSKKDRQHKRK